MGIIIDMHLPILAIIYTVFALFYLVIIAKKRRHSSNCIIISLAFIFYIIYVFKLTIFPIRLLNIELSKYSHLYYQIIPLKTISKVLIHDNWKIQILGNIVLLLPMPLFIGFYQHYYITFKKSFAMIFFTSLSVEFTQLLINIITQNPNKVADIDDLMLNVLGGIIGWAIYSILVKFKHPLYLSKATRNT